MPYRRKARSLSRGRAEGYRSGLEEKIQAELQAAGVPFEYETLRVPYTKPASSYTPDFLLPNGIVIETKGRFVSSDRTKHKLIKQQHPDLDIRFVFSNSQQKIGKKSSTTYAMWCERFDFQYADKSIPAKWLNEPSKHPRTAAAAKVTKR